MRKLGQKETAGRKGKKAARKRQCPGSEGGDHRTAHRGHPGSQLYALCHERHRLPRYPGDRRLQAIQKNPEIRDLLQKSWADIVKSRRYYAVVEGVMERKEATLINYLKENSLNLMYVTKNAKDKDAKKCITNYIVIASNEMYSLLDVNIETGRKNQIRVQLGNLGHYVLGDDKYGEPANPIKRLALHSYELSFVHPVTG